jgi:hypothetical protein
MFGAQGFRLKDHTRLESGVMSAAIAKTAAGPLQDYDSLAESSFLHRNRLKYM